VTYAVIKFRNATIGNGETGLQNKVDERVDVAFFGKVQRQGASAIVSSSFEVLDHIPQKWE
jgi:hypothetical protein